MPGRNRSRPGRIIRRHPEPRRKLSPAPLVRLLSAAVGGRRAKRARPAVISRGRQPSAVVKVPKRAKTRDKTQSSRVASLKAEAVRPEHPQREQPPKRLKRRETMSSPVLHRILRDNPRQKRRVVRRILFVTVSRQPSATVAGRINRNWMN